MRWQRTEKVSLRSFADAGHRGYEEFVMSKVHNSESSFGGQYMIQDRDHMSEISQETDQANRGGVRQADQTQSGGRQQGSGDQSASRQQGVRRSHAD